MTLLLELVEIPGCRGLSSLLGATSTFFSTDLTSFVAICGLYPLFLAGKISLLLTGLVAFVGLCAYRLPNPFLLLYSSIDIG